jgi:hypothetical protein
MSWFHQGIYEWKSTRNLLVGKHIYLGGREYVVCGTDDKEFLLRSQGLHRSIDMGFVTQLTGCCSAAQIHRHGNDWNVHQLKDVVEFLAQLGINTVMISTTTDESDQQEALLQSGLFKKVFTTDNTRGDDDDYYLEYWVSSLKRDHEWVKLGYVYEHDLFDLKVHGEDNDD